MAENRKESIGKKPSGKESWQDRKLKKVVRDDIDVISRKTLDQSDFITMLNSGFFITNSATSLVSGGYFHHIPTGRHFVLSPRDRQLSFCFGKTNKEAVWQV